MTQEAWTFGDGKVSFALVQCYDSEWGPYFFFSSVIFILSFSPLFCSLLAHFILGRLWDSASGLIWNLLLILFQLNGGPENWLLSCQCLFEDTTGLME